MHQDLLKVNRTEVSPNLDWRGKIKEKHIKDSL